MRHITQFLIKLVLTFAFIWAIQYAMPGYIAMNFWQIAMVSVVLSVLSYFADVLIVPQVGRFLGALLDFPLNYVVLWLGSLFMGYRATVPGLITASAAIALLEWINHMLIVDTRKEKD